VLAVIGLAQESAAVTSPRATSDKDAAAPNYSAKLHEHASHHLLLGGFKADPRQRRFAYAVGKGTASREYQARQG